MSDYKPYSFGMSTHSALFEKKYKETRKKLGTSPIFSGDFLTRLLP